LETEIIFSRDSSAAERAAKLLRSGKLVAVPTETVYGLAGDATNQRAVTEIFAVKERPYFDPLILHVPDHSWIERLAAVTGEQVRLVSALVEKFWPGPLTLLLRKSDQVSDLVTAGLPTVAMRMPANAVLQSILRQAGMPLAAPSANRFGRVSPTTAQHVLEELNTRIPLIVDDGPTKMGVESTIVEPRGDKLWLHRPGPVTEKMLAAFGEVEAPALEGVVKAPGQTQSHYAPDKRVVLIDNGVVPADADCAALLSWGKSPNASRFQVVTSLSESEDLLEAASKLFASLRALDHQPVKVIYVERVPETGIGKAIMNRLQRAAATSSDERERARTP
jgi:L-threonylcarbamoyladenylate synthase